MGPLALIQELVDSPSGAPLRRQMEQLWQSSDGRSDMTLMMANSFLFAEARNVLPAIAPRLHETLRSMIDEQTQSRLGHYDACPQLVW